MKSYKSTPKLSTINYIKNQQSDIFSQKGLNKPEIQYTHKRMMPKNTYTTSYNFLEWKETTPYQSPLIRIRLNPNTFSQILNSNMTNFAKYNTNIIPGSKKHKNFSEKMFENEPDNHKNKSDMYNHRYQNETLFLGDYEGNEYKIKKNKSMIYDPSPYFEDKTPLKQKMDLIYGGSEDLIGNYKPAINRNKRLIRSASSIGFARRNFETRNEREPKIVSDSKEMKYFNLYGNKGIENSHNKLKSLSVERSTNNAYIPGEEPIQNRVNFLKSNIFNDKDVEKINNNDYDDAKDNNNQDNNIIRVNRIHNGKGLNKRTKSSNILPRHININFDENTNNENHARRGLYDQNENKLPIELKWNDPKLYLLFPQNKNSDILKKSARDRKFYNIYGTNPISPKEQFKYNDRPEINMAAKNTYNDMNYSSMKRICDNISQMQGKKFINESSKKNKNFRNINKKKNNDGVSYELQTKKSKRFISNNEIEKKFAEKGIHIYDIRENMDSIFRNKKIYKIDFKVRDNYNDNNFEGKINRIKEELLKEKGLIMSEKVNKKRQNNDLMPHDLKWDNPFSDRLTKNIIAEKNIHGKTHSKPPLNRINEEDKITRIFVNLKYKNRPPYNA